MPDLPQPLTDQQVRDLAEEFAVGGVYTLGNVPGSLHLMVFLPLVLGLHPTWAPEQATEVSLYGSIAQHGTMGTAVNGYPVFGAVGFCLRTDMVRVLEMAANICQAVQAVQVPQR